MVAVCTRRRERMICYLGYITVCSMTFLCGIILHLPCFASVCMYMHMHVHLVLCVRRLNAESLLFDHMICVTVIMSNIHKLSSEMAFYETVFAYIPVFFPLSYFDCFYIIPSCIGSSFGRCDKHGMAVYLPNHFSPFTICMRVATFAFATLPWRQRATLYPIDTHTIRIAFELWRLDTVQMHMSINA